MSSRVKLRFQTHRALAASARPRCAAPTRALPWCHGGRDREQHGRARRVPLRRRVCRRSRAEARPPHALASRTEVDGIRGSPRGTSGEGPWLSASRSAEPEGGTEAIRRPRRARAEEGAVIRRSRRAPPEGGAAVRRWRGAPPEGGRCHPPIASVTSLGSSDPSGDSVGDLPRGGGAIRRAHRTPREGGGAIRRDSRGPREGGAAVRR